MAEPAIKKRAGRYTYADYLTWPDEERWELIEGVAYDMTPAPTEKHQRILVELIARVHGAVQGGNCRAYVAPFDVRLPEGDDSSEDAVVTVVQPDLLVICQPDKIDQAGCVGAPDLAVEILSPSTAYKDQTAKLDLYEKHGVREYWIINPVREAVLVYLLEEEGKFGKPVEYRRGEDLCSEAVPGLCVALDEVFSK